MRTTVSGLALLATAMQAPSFTYDGVGLRSDYKTVAARFPHSTPSGGYVRLAPEDIHDHISAIEVSGSGANRRVRITFELELSGGRLDYPRCSAIESRLTREFGPPQELRRVMEEAVPRADRIWRSGSEQLTLICFKGARGVFWAEAVQITPS